MDLKIFNEDIYYYTNIVSEEDKSYALSRIRNSEGWIRVYDDGHVFDPNKDPDDIQNQNCMLASRKYFRGDDVAPEDKKLAKILNKAFTEATKDYAAKRNISGLSMPDIGEMDRHDEGTTYSAHVDTAPLGQESYTVLLYINDDYQGGELSFVLPEKTLGSDMHNGALSLEIYALRSPEDPKNSIIDFWIKPEAMSVVIFPPLKPYAHAAHQVLGGSKYMVKGFWKVSEGETDRGWSSSPYEGRSEDNILETNPEGFIVNGHQHEMIKSGKRIVPEDFVDRVVDENTFK